MVVMVCVCVLLLTPPEEPVAPRNDPLRVEPIAAVEPPSPVALEWRALENPDEAARYYREAADLYLKASDTSNAMRCYANAIDEAGVNALEVSTTDTWLFVAIKQARKKEKDSCVE
jgi:hypothetical protein